MISGTTRLCGLIGNPVEHSLSPFIHNNLAKRLGIDLVYTTFKVEKEGVFAAVKGAYELNILGMNVTVPHKQNVMEPLVDIDPLAKSIGAVNTLVRVDGGYKGYNTDILGLKRELEDENIAIKDEDIIILGAGGAARAIAFLCATQEAKKVYILNRTIEKAKDIADAVNEYVKKAVVVPMSIADYGKLSGNQYIVIQTTSVGLHPNDEDVVIADEAFYDMVKAGVDIIYNPANTKFMRLLQEKGVPAYNGLKMLLYQAVAAFELWNDISVSAEDANYVYKLLQEELKNNG